MLWGCVAVGGTGNIVRVEGTMDSTKSKNLEILEAIQNSEIEVGYSRKTMIQSIPRNIP